MNLVAITQRERDEDDGTVQVCVDLKIGEETSLEFAVVFDAEALNVRDVSWWGFRTEDGCNQLMHENWGAPLPEGEMYEYVIAKAREAL
jgi:hypothetical protein